MKLSSSIFNPSAAIVYALTGLSLSNQFFFYSEKLSPVMGGIIVGVLEVGRLYFLRDLLKRYSLRNVNGIISYLVIAGLCFSGNWISLEYKSRQKMSKNNQNLTALYQNLTAKRIAEIKKEIKDQNNHLLENAGILAASPAARKIEGRSAWRESEKRDLEKKITAFIDRNPETPADYRRWIRQDAVILNAKLSPAELDALNKDNGALAFLGIPGERFEFWLLFILAAVIEFLILKVGRVAWQVQNGDNQKNQKVVKSPSNFDSIKSKNQDVQAKFDELIKNQKCAAWLDEKLSDTAPGSDKNGWRSLGRVLEADRGLFREFRALCNENPEVIENYRRSK